MCRNQSASALHHMRRPGGRPVITQKRIRLVEPQLQSPKGHWHLSRISQVGADDTLLKTIVAQIETSAHKSTRCT
jgi:hypothetical protein